MDDVTHSHNPNPERIEQALADAEAEIARLREDNDRLGGMVEWLAEVIVDAREACQRAEGITPTGSPEWVESGIAMRTTVLREVRQILDRERNANPSRYDEARAAIARVEALRDWIATRNVNMTAGSIVAGIDAALRGDQ